jgi:hypothetical protein
MTLIDGMRSFGNEMVVHGGSNVKLIVHGENSNRVVVQEGKR